VHEEITVDVPSGQVLWLDDGVVARGRPEVNDEAEQMPDQALGAKEATLNSWKKGIFVRSVCL
jgi:hypothetical protein